MPGVGIIKYVRLMRMQGAIPIYDGSLAETLDGSCLQYLNSS